SGQIVRVYVHDNQAVHEGDVLFEIDPEDFQARLAQAESALAALRAQIALADIQTTELHMGAAAARAEVARAAATHDQARAPRARVEPLLPQGFVTQEAVDQARTAVETSQAALESATQRALQAEAAVSQGDVLRAQEPGAAAAVDLAR